jgi:hypothetical protein
VVVWDVRSSKPLKIYHTDKTRACVTKVGNASMNGSASGWLSDDPWDWSRGDSKAPGWGVRAVKFGNGGQCGYPGKEFMTFTEVRIAVRVINKGLTLRLAHFAGAHHRCTDLRRRGDCTDAQRP